MQKQLEGEPGKRVNVLVQLGGSIETAVTGEPAISSLKSKLGDNCDITVSGAGKELYLNHPAVSYVADIVAGENVTRFGHQFMLCDKTDEACGDMHIVNWHGLWLNVKVKNRKPKLYLGDEDLVSAAGLGVSALPHPRVAIAPGSCYDPVQWSKDNWQQLCGILKNTVSASIIQLESGHCGFLGFGSDLCDFENIRTKSAVLSLCDLLVCQDNEFAHMAAAVDIPYVVMYGKSQPNAKSYADAEGLALKRGEDVNEILLEDVINAIVDLCGIEGK